MSSLMDQFKGYWTGIAKEHQSEQIQPPQPSQPPQLQNPTNQETSDPMQLVPEPPEKKFYGNDIITYTVYKSLDWGISTIGGSYALQQFTGDTWEANDVDIFIQCRNPEVFELEVGKFMHRLSNDEYSPSSAQITKKNLDPHGTPISPDRINGRDERFNESIIATCTLEVKDVPKPVQFVGINTGARSLLAHLHDITDVPACVNYTVDDGRRIFHVGEKCRQALFTRQLSGLDICRSRKDKYKERGYDITDI